MPVSRSVAEAMPSLRGALAQSFEDCEILISDDGGQLGGAVEQLQDARVRYHHNSPPLGFVGNHEALMARARGRLIAFLHDDDIWAPSYLQEAVSRLDASPTAGLVLTAHREAPSGDVSPHLRAGCYANALPILLEDRLRLLPSATVFRRAILTDVRSPWPRLSCGDMVLYLDAAVSGWGVAAVDAALVSYARHPGQISADNLTFREDLADLFELYRFNDPVAERLRLHRLAISRLSMARAHLKADRMIDARVQVARALTAERSLQTCSEGLVLNTLGRRPRLLRASIRAWYFIRGIPPTVDHGSSR
jgi:glycosyltransferase involved in cell wall biosynthesis